MSGHDSKLLSPLIRRLGEWADGETDQGEKVRILALRGVLLTILKGLSPDDLQNGFRCVKSLEFQEDIRLAEEKESELGLMTFDPEVPLPRGTEDGEAEGGVS